MAYPTLDEVKKKVDAIRAREAAGAVTPVPKPVNAAMAGTVGIPGVWPTPPAAPPPPLVSTGAPAAAASAPSYLQQQINASQLRADQAASAAKAAGMGPPAPPAAPIVAGAGAGGLAELAAGTAGIAALLYPREMGNGELTPAQRAKAPGGDWIPPAPPQAPRPDYGNLTFPGMFEDKAPTKPAAQQKVASPVANTPASFYTPGVTGPVSLMGNNVNLARGTLRIPGQNEKQFAEMSSNTAEGAARLESMAKDYESRGIKNTADLAASVNTIPAFEAPSKLDTLKKDLIARMGQAPNSLEAKMDIVRARNTYKALEAPEKGPTEPAMKPEDIRKRREDLIKRVEGSEVFAQHNVPSQITFAGIADLAAQGEIPVEKAESYWARAAMSIPADKNRSPSETHALIAAKAAELQNADAQR